MGFDLGDALGIAVGGPIGSMIGSEIGGALENQGNGGCGDAAQDFANAQNEFGKAAYDRSQAQYHRGRASDDFSQGDILGGFHELSEANHFDNAARYHEAEGKRDLAEGCRDPRFGWL